MFLKRDKNTWTDIGRFGTLSSNSIPHRIPSPWWLLMLSYFWSKQDLSLRTINTAVFYLKTEATAIMPTSFDLVDISSVDFEFSQEWGGVVNINTMLTFEHRPSSTRLLYVHLESNKEGYESKRPTQTAKNQFALLRFASLQCVDMWLGTRHMTY